MKSRSCLLLCAFVLSVPSLASADETLSAWAKRRVEAALVQPLARLEQHRSRFSRERPPPAERRVRVLATNATEDKNGRAFVPFAIDLRFGSEWQQNQILGCAYRETGKLFVNEGNAWFPAGLLLGQRVEPAPGVCQAAPPPAS